VKRIVSWLAVLYVALPVLGRSGLPMNAQWGDLVLAPLALAVAWESPLRRWWRAEDWPLAVYLLVTLITAAISAEPTVGFKHLAKQLSVALIFMVFRQLARDEALARRLQITFVAATAFVVVASLMVVFLRIPTAIAPSTLGEAQALPFFGMVRRLRGLFEAPEMLGNTLLLAFLLALGRSSFAAESSRRWWTALAALLALGEFSTYSHSVAGFCLAGVWFVRPSLPSRWLSAMATFGAIVVVLVVNAASVIDPRPPAKATHYEVGAVSFDLFGVRVDGQLLSYAALKRVAWSAFLHHPLSGVGPGRFVIETERAFADGQLPERYRRVLPHCDLTGRLAETGLFGAASLLVLWASWIRSLRRVGLAGTPMQRAASAAVIGLLVNSLNADVMNFRFLWLALAWASWPEALSDEASAPNV
jgi:hypothetical protein